jgi:hypothetical protein
VVPDGQDELSCSAVLVVMKVPIDPLVPGRSLLPSLSRPRVLPVKVILPA